MAASCGVILNPSRNLSCSWRIVKKLFVGLLLLGLATSLAAQQMPGVPVGKTAPTFRAKDQFGKEQTLSSLMGSNGLVLLFFRSADW